MFVFARKLIIMVVLFIFSNAILLWAIPKDNNAYMSEYNEKIKLLETTDQPRVIFIGGSNVAFGLDSKMLQDSLGIHVINFGLHAGVGIRYPMEDCLSFVRKGDIIVVQFEYSNFYDGGNGTSGVLSNLMVSTDWRNFSNLNINQLTNLIGIPKVAFGRLICLICYPLKRSFDTMLSGDKNEKYEYTKAGFNQYGDESLHFTYPSLQYNASIYKEPGKVDSSFMKWLELYIQKYESAGARVLVIPPVCITSYFKKVYSNDVERALEGIKHPYLIKPDSMAIDDSCMFDAVYHINYHGAQQNTKRIVNVLRAKVFKEN